MANICSFKIRVKGRKQDCYAIMNSTNNYDMWEFTNDGTDDKYQLEYEGSCKWGIDCYCEDSDINLKDIIEDGIDYSDWEWLDKHQINNISFKSRSRIFNCDIWICSMIEGGYNDEDYENFHYKNGKELSSKNPPKSLVFERPKIIKRYVYQIRDTKLNSTNHLPTFEIESEAEEYTEELNQKEPRRYCYEVIEEVDWE